ncbi:hypothetical protein E6O75_ATG04130 [Venturia nashicola]|uniref:Uncharacterized protein n=1 Tax=Venturia nashicola TaxID=86259 RepID=A0A4Z1P8U9_9PEZI|nr:hypothetical protein E6O75_ATG04130 [Venturia nashicola]
MKFRTRPRSHFHLPISTISPSLDEIDCTEGTLWKATIEATDDRSIVFVHPPRFMSALDSVSAIHSGQAAVGTYMLKTST